MSKPKPYPKLTSSQAAAFWKKIERGEPDACWMWTAKSRDRKGRGKHRVQKQLLHAPRLAWELANGPLPLSLMVYETCFSFGCCNPAHLGTGTQGEIQALAWRHKNGAPKNRKLAQRAANPQTGAKAYPRFNEEERDLFWGRIDQGRPDVCWPWIGATTGSNGYGVLMRRKRSLRAHRLAYVLVHGPITPVNQVVRHSCDNPPCCNPAHLILGTQLDNAADREARGSQ